jgi:hypothetical protein
MGVRSHSYLFDGKAQSKCYASGSGSPASSFTGRRVPSTLFPSGVDDDYLTASDNLHRADRALRLGLETGADQTRQLGDLTAADVWTLRTRGP